MHGTYQLKWPIIGLLGRQEAIVEASRQIRLHLSAKGFEQAGFIEWRVRDATDRDATDWPEHDPDEIAQVLVADIPVTGATA